jgi:hypothetical protein
VQPEEALALLASASAAREPIVIVAAAAPDQPTPIDQVDINPLEEAVSEQQPKWARAVVIGIVIGLAATAAFAYWLLH